jgi:hypothetical protein
LFCILKVNRLVFKVLVPSLHMSPWHFTKAFLERLKLKQKGPLHRGTATTGQNLATRVAGVKGWRRERQEGNKSVLFEALGEEGVDQGSLSMVAQSRRRVWMVGAIVRWGRWHGERLCSLRLRRRRWWKGWFGQCWGGVVCPRAGCDSPELEVGGDELRGLWWGFYRREGREWLPGLKPQGKARPGAKPGVQPRCWCWRGLAVAPVAPAIEEKRRVEAS